MENYSYGMTGAEMDGFLAFFATFYLIILAIAIVQIVALWKVFKKAGKPGWAAIVPFYNTIVMLDIAGYAGWKLVLFFIPFYNIYFTFKVYIAFAKAYGKSTFFGVMSVFFPMITMLILAFGNAEYVGQKD